MSYRPGIGLALLGFALSASPTYAAPIQFSIDSCVLGDCASFDASGRGSIIATLDVINGNDLLITLDNDLNADALNDDPYLTNLGFEYGGLLSGLTFDSFTVLSGVVGTPTFVVDSAIRTFSIDFGFAFSQEGRSLTSNRFQAMDPNEVVQILIGTTGDVNLDAFDLGVAKVAGAGLDARSGPITLIGDRLASVPEPSSLFLTVLGLAAGTVRRRRKA